MPGLTTTLPYPRSRYTVTEARDRVRGDLALRGSSFLTDAEILAWLNEAQDIFAREVRWFTYALSLSTVANTAEYAFPDAASAQVLSIDQVRLDDRTLWPMAEHSLSRGNTEWRDHAGTPTHWFLRGMNAIRLYPYPTAASSNGLDLFGVGLPPIITNADDQFYLPNGFDHALLAYAKMMATRKDAHGEGSRRAGLYEAEWREALDRGKREMNEAGEHGVLHVGSDGGSRGNGAGGWFNPFGSIQAPP